LNRFIIIKLNIILSSDLLAYYNNNGELELSSSKAFFELFKLNQLDQVNKEYEVASYCPNFLLIGTNGGGAGVFENRTSGLIYSSPLIGMSEVDATFLAETFSDFMEKFKSDQIEII
jgi:hypothetical protein